MFIIYTQRKDLSNNKKQNQNNLQQRLRLINVLQAGKKGLQVKLLQQILHKEADNNHLVNLQRLFCLIIKAIIIILVK